MAYLRERKSMVSLITAGNPIVCSLLPKNKIIQNYSMPAPSQNNSTHCVTRFPNPTISQLVYLIFYLLSEV
jgi:hypothetical protein